MINPLIKSQRHHSRPSVPRFCPTNCSWHRDTQVRKTKRFLDFCATRCFKRNGVTWNSISWSNVLIKLNKKRTTIIQQFLCGSGNKNPSIIYLWWSKIVKYLLLVILWFSIAGNSRIFYYPRLRRMLDSETFSKADRSDRRSNKTAAVSKFHTKTHEMQNKIMLSQDWINAQFMMFNDVYERVHGGTKSPFSQYLSG